LAIIVQVNGVNYSIPQEGETGWGSNVTSWIQSVSTNVLQKTGGTFTLSAEVDFGNAAGLKTLYYKSRAASPASSGVVRLGNNESVSWRNS